MADEPTKQDNQASQADGYYGDEDLDLSSDELDLSFLDEEDTTKSEEQK